VQHERRLVRRRLGKGCVAVAEIFADQQRATGRRSDRAAEVGERRRADDDGAVDALDARGQLAHGEPWAQRGERPLSGGAGNGERERVAARLEQRRDHRVLRGVRGEPFDASTRPAK
jgi:hypothetical protein